MKLLKKTIEQVLNEIFSTDVNQNEHETKNFKKEYDLWIFSDFIF